MFHALRKEDCGLRKMDGYCANEVQFIDNARTPVIKLSMHGFNVDITWHNRIAVRNVSLLRMYASCELEFCALFYMDVYRADDKRVIVIIRAMKTLCAQANFRNFSSEGLLSSYAVTLMVLCACQQSFRHRNVLMPPILPCL